MDIWFGVEFPLIGKGRDIDGAAFQVFKVHSKPVNWSSDGHLWIDSRYIHCVLVGKRKACLCCALPEWTTLWLGFESSVVYIPVISFTQAGFSNSKFHTQKGQKGHKNIFTDFLEMVTEPDHKQKSPVWNFLSDEQTAVDQVSKTRVRHRGWPAMNPGGGVSRVFLYLFIICVCICPKVYFKYLLYVSPHCCECRRQNKERWLNGPLRPSVTRDTYSR